MKVITVQRSSKFYKCQCEMDNNKNSVAHMRWVVCNNLSQRNTSFLQQGPLSKNLFNNIAEKFKRKYYFKGELEMKDSTTYNIYSQRKLDSRDISV